MTLRRLSRPNMLASPMTGEPSPAPDRRPARVHLDVPAFGAAQQGAPSPLDRDILSLNELSDILRATPDTVRRIPRHELPVCRGPGRDRLYLRSDVLLYLQRRRINL